jgi:hypothetical protein
VFVLIGFGNKIQTGGSVFQGIREPFSKWMEAKSKRTEAYSK